MPESAATGNLVWDSIANFNCHVFSFYLVQEIGFFAADFKGWMLEDVRRTRCFLGLPFNHVKQGRGYEGSGLIHKIEG